MPIASPRLDDPSAIGDEGRARAASLWLASLVVFAVVGAIGVRAGEPELLPALALLVGLTVAGVALLDRNSFAQLFVGHLLVVTAGSALSVLVLAAPIVDRALFVVAACAVALVGVAAAWADVGSEEIGRAVKSGLLTYLTVLVSSVAVGTVAVAAFFGWVSLDSATAVDDALGSVVVSCLAVVVSASCLRLALRKLPVRQLAPRSRREDALRYLRIGDNWLRVASIGCLLALVGSLFLWPLLDVEYLLADRPSLENAILGLSDPALVWPLLAVGVGTALVAYLLWGLRALVRQIAVTSTRQAVAVITGVVITGVGTVWAGLLYVGLVRGLSDLTWGLSTTGVPVATLLVVGPLAFAVAGGLAIVARWLGLLPARATGPAISAVGLLLVAVGLGGGEPLFVFGCIAAALLVWDVSTFGLGLTAELGHRPETRRLELFHGAVAVAVSLGAVLVVVGLESLRTGMFAGIGGTTGAILVAFGAVLLLVPLRG